MVGNQFDTHQHKHLREFSTTFLQRFRTVMAVLPDHSELSSQTAASGGFPIVFFPFVAHTAEPCLSRASLSQRNQKHLTSNALGRTFQHHGTSLGHFHRNSIGSAGPKTCWENQQQQRNPGTRTRWTEFSSERDRSDLRQETLARNRIQ